MELTHSQVQAPKQTVVVSTTWLRQAAFIAALAFYFLTFYSRPFSTGDTMWSNFVGQWIVTHGKVPTQVFGTWTAVGQHWMPQEWGFETVLYATSHYFGYLGVVLLMTTVSTFTWVIFTNTLQKLRISYAWFWGFLAGAFSLPWDQIRAETFSYLFFALTLWTLSCLKNTKGQLVFLVCLQVVWVNMHGSFMLEWLLTLSFAVSALCPSVDTHWIQHCPLGKKQAMKWFGVTALLIAVSLINPQGFGLYRFAVWLSLHSGVQKYIMEWQPALATEWPSIVLGLTLVIMLVIRLHHKERLPLLETAWAILVFTMYLKSVRFGSYALMTTPWAFAPRQAWGNRSIQWVMKHLKALKGFMTTFLLAIFVAFSALFINGIGSVHGGLYQNANSAVFPHAVKVVQSIEQAHPSWRVWNAYAIGGTLETEGVNVSIDGRTEIYLHNGIMEKYMSTMGAKLGAVKYLNAQHIQLVCLETKEPLDELLTALPNWKRVYDGQGYAVFERVDSR